VAYSWGRGRRRRGGRLILLREEVGRFVALAIGAGDDADNLKDAGTLHGFALMFGVLFGDVGGLG
jgi:hypothetical protein